MSKYHIYVLLIVFFMFQIVIGNYLSVFRLYDEIVAIFAFVFFCFQSIKAKKVLKKDFVVCMLLLMLVLIGIYGNQVSKGAQNAIAIIEDILAYLKIFMVTFLFRNNKISIVTLKKLRNFFNIFCKLLIIVMFICALLTEFYNFGMGHAPRYGLLSFKFIFPNAPALNTFFYFFSVLYSLVIYINGRFERGTTIYILMMCFSWMLTLRSRAIIFGFIYILIYFFILYKPQEMKKIKFKTKHFMVICGIAIIWGWNTFSKYFINNEREVRYIMLRTSFKIARNLFPYGSGFATFGSEASRKFYSKIYYEYGIADVWGISKETGASFVLDQFWFGVIGQFGLLGVVILIILIGFLYLDIWKKAQADKGCQLAAITFIYTTLIGSISAATYINSYALATIIVLYLFINSTKKEVEHNLPII